jgi:cytochrome c-type biogenesis protein CcsB
VHLNIGLADFSQGLLLSAIVIYALAMLAYAGDFAFGRRPASVLAGAQGTVAAAPELVGAAAAAPGNTGAVIAPPAADPGPPPGHSAEPPGPARPAPAGQDASKRGAWVRVAFILTCTGLAAHITGIVTRGVAEHRVPWGNMYEFIMAISCMAVIVLVVVASRYQAYYIGLFVLIPVVFALGLAVTVVYTPAGAVVPALQSYWIAIHVTAMIIASGLYTVGAVVTVMYLFVDRNQRRVAAGLPAGTSGIVAHLPKSAVLDRLSYRVILAAFPVWTFGVMAGAIWADQAWGRYWGWDPKETWSFITWVVYAGFLHARATAGWRGRRAAYIQLTAFACLIFNLVGVNLWVSGLHSYAGLS